jgi:ATP-dependent DNA ligase
MPLGRRREPFDHPEWLFELKYDGFRALAYVDGGGAKLVSRRNLEYRRFEDLASLLSLEVNADDAVLDGEIVKLDEMGRPVFLDLMRRRGPFCFVAFDLLAVNGQDVRKLPLSERKRTLREIVPKESRCILFARHVPERGRDLFAAVCEQDLEGIVAKWKDAPYNPAVLPLSWLKVKNPEYSQARDRHELFATAPRRVGNGVVESAACLAWLAVSSSSLRKPPRDTQPWLSGTCGEPTRTGLSVEEEIAKLLPEIPCEDPGFCE